MPGCEAKVPDSTHICCHSKYETLNSFEQFCRTVAAAAKSKVVKCQLHSTRLRFPLTKNCFPLTLIGIIYFYPHDVDAPALTKCNYLYIPELHAKFTKFSSAVYWLMMRCRMTCVLYWKLKYSWQTNRTLLLVGLCQLCSQAPALCRVLLLSYLLIDVLVFNSV